MSKKTQTISKKTVFVSGNFNIIHPGHLRLLTFAAQCGDYLVVALYENNQSTFVDFDLRKDSLDSLGFVDKVIGIPINELENTIENLQPDIVVKGKEHQTEINIETDILESYNGK